MIHADVRSSAFSKKRTECRQSIWVAVVCWLVGIGSAWAAEETVVLQLKWRHQFQFAGYYAAIQQGYYKEAGLKVELREAVPGHDPAEEVLNGKADFGVGTSNLVLLRAQGHPVVVLAVIYQHSPFVLLTTADSGIRDIHQMAQHPIMMEPDAAELLAYFKNEGINPDTLKLLPHSFDALDLVSGKIRAMTAYSTDEPFHVKAAGSDYLVFTPRASGIDFYGDNLFTTEAQLQKHPARTRAFVKASLKGWEYALRHPEEIVELILRDYPSRGDKTREQLLFEARESARLIHPELIEIGYINPGRWKSIAQTYADLGMIPTSFSTEEMIPFSANEPLDLRWLYWVGGISLALGLGVLGWSVLVARMNRRLRVEVDARTEAEARARAESDAKSHLLAVLAHEVRSPLSGICASLGLCACSPPEERQELMDIAEASAATLLQMLDNLLNHAKLESGCMKTDRLPVSPREMIDDLMRLFRAAIITRGTTLEVQISPQVPQRIVTDPTLLRHILSNLISNAIKFSEGSALNLLMDVGQPSGETMELSVVVSDGGPGLSEEQIAVIFEPYLQIVSGEIQRGSGSGLGLAIASEFTRLLGGEIVVESAPRQGSTFTLRLPVQCGPIIRGF